ncbi:MAG: efflux RND transporter permease subunit, partial [Gammaproteobacteria bacterium]
VRLGDIAEVEIGPADERRMSRFTGKSAIGFGLIKQSTANPLDVSKGVRAEIERLKEILPEGMEVSIGFDSSLFVEESIERVFITIFEASALVVLVIFLFLRDWRATLVPLVTIPVALIGALFLMYTLGFSINTITLLAFVLAIGLVVDDAIVMLENIYRHIEQGMPPLQAAFRGSRQIGFAIIAMTFTLAAVFAPIAFTEGKTGKLFTEFALTLAGAVIVSGFVALTLSATMSSRMLTHHRHGTLFNLTERGIVALIQGYRYLLGQVLTIRPAIIVTMIVVAAFAAALYERLPSELAPVEDRGSIMSFASAPEGATLKYMNEYTQEVDRIFLAVPEIESYQLIMGWPTVTNMMSFIRLAHWNERERGATEVARSIVPQLMAIPGIRAFATNPPALGSGGPNQAIQFIIQTTSSYEELEADIQEILGRLEGEPAL